MRKQARVNGTTPAGGRRAAAIAVLLSLAAVPPAGNAQPMDDYTREIMAEGSRLETLGEAHREREILEKSMAKSRPAPKPEKAAVTVAPKETDAAFEANLRATFPASFALYSLLTPEEKTAVRAEYDQSTSPGAARFHPVVSKIIAFSTKKR